MKMIHATLAGVALASFAAIGFAQAASDGATDSDQQDLPPLSGTIHMAPDGLGRHHGPRGHYLLDGRRASAHRWAYHRGDGSAYHYGGFAYAQPRRYGYGQGSVFWNRSVRFYGEGNDTLATTVTGWGTADSATTGGSYPLPSPRSHAAYPVQLSYGTPSYGYGAGGLNRTYAPTGGLAYYNSGSSGQMAYYSSSSSAGRGGTPGGLGIYSSGSFGPGPKIIRFDGRASGRRSEGSAGGPHIIHVGHHRGWAELAPGTSLSDE